MSILLESKQSLETIHDFSRVTFVVIRVASEWRPPLPHMPGTRTYAFFCVGSSLLVCSGTILALYCQPNHYLLLRCNRSPELSPLLAMALGDMPISIPWGGSSPYFGGSFSPPKTDWKENTVLLSSFLAAPQTELFSFLQVGWQMQKLFYFYTSQCSGENTENLGTFKVSSFCEVFR